MSFYTTTILNDARTNSKKAIADLNLLEPVTRALVQNIIEEARNSGLNLMIFETYRSKQRQQLLYEQGVTKLKTVGVHHYGLACDLVRKINGQPSWKGDFTLLGKLAYKHGLIWGGDWGNPLKNHSFVDVYHVQRCSIQKQPKLFNGSWYPDENYNPYND